MLIKSTTAAIPSYAKDTFLFLDTICSKLDKIFKGFWWGFPKGKSRNLSLKSWSSICLPRQACGFGFRLMKDVNLAPIAKLGWKSLTNFDSIWVQQLSVKYIKYGSFFFSSPFPSLASWLWKGIQKSKPLMVSGACLQVAKSSALPIWTSAWIPTMQDFKPIPGFLVIESSLLCVFLI
jgi:hypothetical protein